MKIGEEAELQLPRAKALLVPASWELGKPGARDVFARLLLHLPAFEVKNATAAVFEAWLATYAEILKEVPLDCLADAAKTALTIQPPLREFPTPAKFLELLQGRRWLGMRKTRLLLLERIATAKRRDPEPKGQASEVDITDQLDRYFKRGKYAVGASAPPPSDGEEAAP